MRVRRCRAVLALCVVCAATLGACTAGRVPPHEYAEDVALSMDGSARVSVYASVPALIALRGAPFDADAAAAVDTARVREWFAGPGVHVRSVTASRRAGRRFVYVRLTIDEVTRLSQVAPFAWAQYDLDRSGELIAWSHAVHAAAGRHVGDVGWTGDERVVFRLHAPGPVQMHNAATAVRRGNILEWEQTLAARLNGAPLQMQLQMERESILYRTLLVFGSSAAAAAAAFAIIIWRVVRRGRRPEPRPAFAARSAPRTR